MNVTYSMPMPMPVVKIFMFTIIEVATETVGLLLVTGTSQASVAHLNELNEPNRGKLDEGS